MTVHQNFPVNPSIGQSWNGWVWNGGIWVCQNQGPIAIVQKFLVSGSYFPSPGMTYCIVECVGGGGGGGQVSWVGATVAQGGGGGGSGGFSRKLLTAAQVAGGVVVTVGLGGGTEAAGTPTTFGALCVANGGGAGEGTGQGAQGGVEATPGIGDVAFAGSPGFNGPVQSFPTETLFSASGGLGGAIFGGNRNVAVGAGSGGAGTPAWPNSGGGGQGGVINQMPTTGGPFPGGAGGTGVCTVTDYCFGPFPQGSGDCCPGGARVPIGFCEEG